jgi:hypothetical protein
MLAETAAQHHSEFFWRWTWNSSDANPGCDTSSLFDRQATARRGSSADACRQRGCYFFLAAFLAAFLAPPPLVSLFVGVGPPPPLIFLAAAFFGAAFFVAIVVSFIY